MNFVPKALEITGLDMNELQRTGTEPCQAMSDFAEWISATVSPDTQPVMTGLAAAFDWLFVSHYFHAFHGSNPFGFTPLDLKPFFMGVTGCDWRDAKSSVMNEVLEPSERGDHNALQDAIYQAELFRLIRQGPRTAG